MMTTRTSIRATIDAISKDSEVTGSPADVADALKRLYPGIAGEVLDAIDDLLDDSQWSQDREPYEWLQSVAACFRAN